MRRRDTRVDASSGYCRPPAGVRRRFWLLRPIPGGGVAAFTFDSRRPAPLLAVALDLAGQLVGHEVDRVRQVRRGLARPQRDALQVERRLGHLVLALDQQLDLELGELGDLLADAGREAVLHVLPEPVRDRGVAASDLDFHDRPPGSLRQWLAPHATWRPGRAPTSWALAHGPGEAEGHHLARAGAAQRQRAGVEGRAGRVHVVHEDRAAAGRDRGRLHAHRGARVGAALGAAEAHLRPHGRPAQRARDLEAREPAELTRDLVRVVEAAPAVAGRLPGHRHQHAPASSPAGARALIAPAMKRAACVAERAFSAITTRRATPS